jgi:hypothetical protein
MTDKLTKALRKRFPNVDAEFLSPVRKAIIHNIGSWLLSGEQLAHVRENNHAMELSIFYIDSLLHQPQEWSIVERKFKLPPGKAIFDTTESSHQDITSLLKLQVPMKSLVSTDKFLTTISHVITDVDFAYSILSLLTANLPKGIYGLYKFLKSQKYLPPESLIKENLYPLLEENNVPSLRVVASHYRSPISIDLLGISTSIGTLREIIKDITCRSKHEQSMAKLEEGNKQLELEKVNLDNKNFEIELAKKRLDLEKMAVEITTQKVDLLAKVANLNLDMYNSSAIVNVLAPKVANIASLDVLLRTKSDEE